MGNKLLENILTSSKYDNSTSHTTACQNLQACLAFTQAELDVDIWMYLPITWFPS
jgi:hypothetical protein